MTLPPGFKSAKKNQVCHLQKSLYGLKQASRQCYSKLSSALISLGFKQSVSDYSLFVKKTESCITVLLVYVDDLLLPGTNLDEITTVKHFLDNKFKIKAIGDLKFFLSLEVARSKAGISLNQRNYALDIFADTGFLDGKATNTPMDCKLKLSKDSGVPLEDILQYRRLIVRLLYITSTRVDITFVV